ncbi:MAG: 50S ribosomal protein L29 [Candidatus Riflebacteria bacterium RBG_13_59_9]|nr:MAG: 50S ribosomal protein L29 [Candidatus Riflebacteria bacterium RBG_13_59_9]
MSSKSKLVELRKSSLPELRKRLRELKSEHYQLRFERITGKLENYRRIRELRRDIGRVNTLIAELENKS